ncbi:hypothetical protein [Paraliomyxa miuraensis]|uniref:hypothetical protein n=1 Tax=Paraliomyxa miuraensis TaxID=376150 RepID=UPI002255B542|nr:hypothetical protein [Paraliomyxa miuraensis]MCX4241976.1 hypothetical protein [Paraliomyxa miuraensis]
MTCRTSFRPGLGLLLLPLALASACNGDDVAVTGDESGGIASLDDGSTGEASTGATSEVADSSGGPSGPCANGELDGDETDVDCGGSSCEPCGPGGKCETASDCDTMICSGGFCQTPTCYDGMKNGSEEGVDCGGTCPNTCPGSECDNDAQCGDGQFCHQGDCAPSSCDNDLKDTLETDVDCGGPECPNCGPGEDCDVAADCESQVCGGGGQCEAPSCSDDVLNGLETDLDCGGPCPPCPVGGSCEGPADCTELVCDDGTCLDDSCDDQVANGNETDVDCGGAQCDPCTRGHLCDVGLDCEEGVCIAGFCLPAECDDLVHNGDETDLDCGGSCGATCMPGLDCNSPADCAEGVCEFGQCSAPDCDDGVTNGDESDVDCGGLDCGPTCAVGEACVVGMDCSEGVCTGGVCSPPVCDDGAHNGNETDVDCGGSCGATCVPGEGCDDAGDCLQGVCVLGVCQAPTCNDGVFNGFEGGIDCAGPCAQPCPVGGEAVVNTTLPDFQVRPVVATAPNGSFFVVVWASFPFMAPPQDGSGAGVFARVYDATGVPITGEIQINTSTMGNQAFPAVDANNAGFVVVWEGPDADDTGIFAQRVSSAGALVGPELELLDDPAGEQRRPDVGLEPDGEFVACWEHRIAVFADIACRRFGGLGTPISPQLIVNAQVVSEQNLPVVEAAITGNFVVAWQSSASQDGQGVGVFMRRFNAAGIPLSATDEQVNQFFALDQQGAAIGMNSSGEFVIAWTSDGQDGSGTGVYARAYNSVGAPMGGEFQVNTTTLGAQNNPAVALNPDGDFIVVWQTADDGVLTGVFGQRYDQNAAPSNSEFLVNPTIFGLQEDPDVAIRGMDEIVAVWSEGDAGFTDRNVRLQRYQALFP